MRLAGLGIAGALAAGWPVLAQQQVPPAAQQQETSATWESFPTMPLEQVYRGPLRDTVIQRWRDPVDGTVCFLYIPISAPLLPQQPGARYMQYGPNTIGSVSCVHPTQVVHILQHPSPPPQQAPAQRPASPPRPGGQR